MDIKIAVLNEVGKFVRMKRLREVKKYPDFTHYDVVTKDGTRLYSECYTEREIERLII